MVAYSRINTIENVKKILLIKFNISMFDSNKCLSYLFCYLTSNK